jgi:hypothetical protein
MSDISITLDRYGHLMPDSEAEAATLFDTYLAADRARKEDQARGAAVAVQPLCMESSGPREILRGRCRRRTSSIIDALTKRLEPTRIVEKRAPAA